MHTQAFRNIVTDEIVVVILNIVSIPDGGVDILDAAKEQLEWWVTTRCFKPSADLNNYEPIQHSLIQAEIADGQLMIHGTRNCENLSNDMNVTPIDTEHG